MKHSLITNLFISMRPQQWVKNLIIYAGIIFAQQFFKGPSFLKVSFAFLLFCLITSCIYLINDLKDIEKDKIHPIKKFRPLSSGRLSPKIVLIFLIVLAPLCLWLSFWLDLRFGFIVLLYFFIMVGYSFGLKEIIIIDAFIIAMGFVLRGIAGVEVMGIEMSPWFFLCASLLALFIVFCKRKHELLVLNEQAGLHRTILKQYNHTLLDQLVSITAASVILTYALYTLAPETVLKFNTRKLVYTVPFVLLGLFRFLYLVYKKEKGGSAEKLMLSDWPLICVMFSWLGAVLIILY